MRSERIAALLAELVTLVVDERAEKQASEREFEQDLLVAQLAAGMLGPEQLGDENAALAAVHTARLLLKHARRDVFEVAPPPPGDKPS